MRLLGHTYILELGETVILSVVDWESRSIHGEWVEGVLGGTWWALRAEISKASSIGCAILSTYEPIHIEHSK